MAKKKEKRDLAAELTREFEEWERLREYGGSDPSYADGSNMDLVRNHIIYYKNKMMEEYGSDYEKYPEIFYRELPPEIDLNYMARAGEIRDGAVQSLERYLADPNFRYLFANQDMLTEKESNKISLYGVLGEVSGLARAIKSGDLITMRRHARRPDIHQESFAKCAGQMQEIINNKKKDPEQMQENEQFSLFQFGMGTGHSR